MALHGVMTLTALRVDPQFGEMVRRVFDAHGKLSLEQARLKTKVDHQTLNRMKKGEVPRVDKVEAFAMGFKLDVNEWRQLAGYDPVESGTQILDAGLYRLSQRVGELIPWQGETPREKLTPDQARQALAEVEEDLREQGKLTD